MILRSFRFTAIVVSLMLGIGLAQPQTLSLDSQNVYLSDPSRNLEALASYRQHYSVTTARSEEGQAEDQAEESVFAWTNELAASGDRHSRLTSTGVMNSVSAHYLIDAHAFFYMESEGEASCMAWGEFAPINPGITVSNVTGFREASLVSEGETVNGVLADRYRLEPPPFNNYYEVASLEGELWVARNGGYIVRYWAKGSSGTSAHTWAYELEAVDGLAAIALPAPCESQ